MVDRLMNATSLSIGTMTWVRAPASFAAMPGVAESSIIGGVTKFFGEHDPFELATRLRSKRSALPVEFRVCPVGAPTSAAQWLACAIETVQNAKFGADRCEPHSPTLLGIRC